MRLPEVWNKGDVVEFVEDHYIYDKHGITPDGRNLEIPKGTMGVIQQVSCEGSRNGFSDFINIILVISIFYEDRIPVTLRVNYSERPDLVRKTAAAQVLYSKG